MSMQMVQVAFETEPTIDPRAIVDRVEELIQSGITIPEDALNDSALLFFHSNHEFELSDGKMCGQTALLKTSEGFDSLEGFADELQQSWDCDEAEELLSGITSLPLLSELMSQGLEPSVRLELFHGVLQAVVEQTQPKALVFKHSQQILSPRLYLDSCDQPPILRPGALNVRFFNISNSDGDMLMDTRGLSEIGLHDVQCHYRQIEPDAVARVLFNVGCYIVEQGAIIESGQTIDGHEPDSTWLCQFEDALVDPERVLLDLDPGEPFAAGGRTTESS